MRLEFAQWLGNKLTKRKDRTKGVEGSQQWLAEEIGVSTGMISHYQRGAELPTDDMAEAILDALGVTSQLARHNILRTIKRDRNRLTGKEQSAAGQYKFGEVLRQIFEGFSISPRELDEIIYPAPQGLIQDRKQPSSTISLWLSGRKLPSDETLQDKIIPALKKLRPRADLNKLKIAHFEDVMKKALALGYLNRRQQQQLLEKITLEYENQVS